MPGRNEGKVNFIFRNSEGIRYALKIRKALITNEKYIDKELKRLSKSDEKI